MKIEVKRVTPAMAEKWLKKNHPRNRRISDHVVAGLIADIQAGNWKITHQGICFDGEGWLIDGQHRLHAVLRAGTPVDMVVAENDASTISDPIDTHRKRTTSYLTGMRNREVAACRVLDGLQQGYAWGSQYTSGQASATFERFAKDFEALAVARRASIFGGPLAAFVWAGPISDRINDFATQFTTGEMIKRGDPAFALRGWFESNKTALQPWESALATLNCITHFLCNKELRAVYATESGYRFITTKRRVLKIPNTPGTDLVQTLTRPGFEK